MGLLLALIGCVAPEPASHELAVVGGFVQPEEDATVRMHVVTGHNCSGTLVAPRIVVTAKHCFVNYGMEGWTAGVGPTGEDRVFDVEEVILTPDAVPTLEDEDLAVAILAEPIDDVVPRPLPWSGDDVHDGDDVRLIGYGTTNAGTFGIKNETTDPIAAVHDFELSTSGNGPCPGDSGGSVVDADGVLVGVIDRAPEGCVLPPPARTSYHARVFAWLDVVAEAFERTETCWPTAIEACNGRDDDCDEVVDEGCSSLGDTCAVDDDCLSGICSEGACAAPCDDGPCPLGSRCVAGECRLEGPSDLGDPCTADDECQSLVCAHWEDGSACGESCDETAPCPEDFSCTDGWCAPDLAVTGEPCRENADCVRGVCADVAHGRRCTEICDDDEPCPAGFDCVATQDDVRICARPSALVEEGGCRTSPSDRRTSPLGLLFALAALAATRRR